MIEIKNSEYCTMIAPNGEVQFAMMGEDELEVKGMIRFMAANGMSFTYDQLIAKGFELKRVRLTVTESK